MIPRSLIVLRIVHLHVVRNFADKLHEQYSDRKHTPDWVEILVYNLTDEPKRHTGVAELVHLEPLVVDNERNGWIIR